MNNNSQQFIDKEFSSITGLTVDASISISEKLLNDRIASELQGNEKIAYCRVSVEPHNRLDVHIKTSFWTWPLNLKLRVFSSVDFNQPPKIRAFLENHVLLAKLGSLLKALPHGIDIYKDQISVELEPLLKDLTQKRLLSLVKKMEIRSEVGKIIIDVKIEA